MRTIRILLDREGRVWYNLKMKIKIKLENPMSQYKTRQRDEILRFFMEHPDGCFAAKDVYKQVNAGEATVFRALSSLAQEGILQKFTGDGGAYYQYSRSNTCTDHIHLKCERCGKLIHMDCTFLREMMRHFCSEHGFTVDCGKTVIYGLCGECGTPHGENCICGGYYE